LIAKKIKIGVTRLLNLSLKFRIKIKVAKTQIATNTFLPPYAMATTASTSAITEF
jgi:hypothetical protein